MKQMYAEVFRYGALRDGWRAENWSRSDDDAELTTKARGSQRFLNWALGDEVFATSR